MSNGRAARRLKLERLAIRTQIETRRHSRLQLLQVELLRARNQKRNCNLKGRLLKYNFHPFRIERR